MMIERSEIDELITPDDIIEGGEIELEIAPAAFSAPLHCWKCGALMRVVTATKELWDGKITLSYEIFACPQCGERCFNGEQAQRYGKILVLLKALDDTAPAYEQMVQRANGNAMVTLPTGENVLRATVKPVSHQEFLVSLAA